MRLVSMDSAASEAAAGGRPLSAQPRRTSVTPTWARLGPNEAQLYARGAPTRGRVREPPRARHEARTPRLEFVVPLCRACPTGSTAVQGHDVQAEARRVGCMDTSSWRSVAPACSHAPSDRCTHPSSCPTFMGRVEERGRRAEASRNARTTRSDGAQPACRASGLQRLALGDV